MSVVCNMLTSMLEATEEAKEQEKKLVEVLSWRCYSLEYKLKWFLAMAEVNEMLEKEALLRLIDRSIAAIDDLLNEQVNIIIHHPRFQKLEASWRGLAYLLDQVDEMGKVKVRVLNLSWRHLIKDFERSIDFDQSHIFRKIYSDEFGMSGGQPFGVLLGDYEVRHRVSEGYYYDDMFALREMANVAAASFAPFIVGASPALFGLDSFSGLGLPLNFEAIFGQKEYDTWNRFRSDCEESRFVGITVPKMLMRLPYKQDNFRHDGFIFDEDVSNPDGSGYLWGNACYAYGAVLVNAFYDSGWFTDIRGNSSGPGTGGVVSGLPIESYSTDSPGTVSKITTDILVTDELEKALGDIGFMALCHSKGTDHAVFFSCPSVYKSPVFDTVAATVNARMSSMLQYVMCTSRFAQYIKVIGREKVGGFNSASDIQKYLGNWLRKYTMNNPNASPELRAKHPLADGRVEVKERLGKTGVFACNIHLKPHMQHDNMVSAVKLVTELAKAKG